MHLYIAALSLLLASVVAVQAQDRNLTALADPAFGPGHQAQPDRESDPRAFATSQDGFSGSFSARQAARTLGY